MQGWGFQVIEDETPVGQPGGASCWHQATLGPATLNSGPTPALGASSPFPTAGAAVSTSEVEGGVTERPACPGVREGSVHLPWPRG